MAGLDATFCQVLFKRLTGLSRVRRFPLNQGLQRTPSMALPETRRECSTLSLNEDIICRRRSRHQTRAFLSSRYIHPSELFPARLKDLPFKLRHKNGKMTTRTPQKTAQTDKKNLKKEALSEHGKPSLL